MQVIWPGIGSVSYYLPQAFGGQVSSETITIASGEEQWRAITMYHEYGHATMTAAYGYNYDAVPTENYQGSHCLDTVSDPGFTFNEGWAAFMEAAVDNRALNVTGYLGREVPNIESNQWWMGHVNGQGSNTSGEKVEGTVASILWDTFDTADAIDHQLGVDDDSIANQFNLLWEILINDRPQSITDVAEAWRKKGFPAQAELEEIYETHHTRSRTNLPSIFRFNSPAIDGALADSSFHVTWEANDPDGDDFTIGLFYDIDRRPGGAILIQFGILSDLSQFNWNTNSVVDGRYYLRAVITDVQNDTTEVYSNGLVIVDHTPLLPPVITSDTHPSPNRWYASNAPQLNLFARPNQITGWQYSFILNYEPETVPDTIPDALVQNNKLTLEGLNNGAWWVHVRAHDELGYWTDANHFAIKIDSTAPLTVTNLRWLTEMTGDASEIALEWDAVEDMSCITAYHIQIDVNSRDFQSDLFLNDAVDGAVTRYTFYSEPNATYYARIKAENRANLLSCN